MAAALCGQRLLLCAPGMNSSVFPRLVPDVGKCALTRILMGAARVLSFEFAQRQTRCRNRGKSINFCVTVHGNGSQVGVMGHIFRRNIGNVC